MHIIIQALGLKNLKPRKIILIPCCHTVVTLEPGFLAQPRIISEPFAFLRQGPRDRVPGWKGSPEVYLVSPCVFHTGDCSSGEWISHAQVGARPRLTAWGACPLTALCHLQEPTDCTKEGRRCQVVQRQGEETRAERTEGSDVLRSDLKGAFRWKAFTLPSSIGVTPLFP